MAQESISKTVAVIGAGPAGCICAKFLSDYGFEVSLFDKGKFLRTLLPTGGGKCNLANALYDFKELAQNYPRGEKFLYSVFSKFSTSDTLDFFKSIGVETYTREDNRIFPISNSAKEVREKLLKSLKCNFISEEVLKVEEGYKVITNKSKYFFDIVVIAIGGHSGVDLLKTFDIRTIPQTPSLVGLKTKEDFSSLSGVSINNVLFTHKGVSGPLIYEISSKKARENFPYKIFLKLVQIDNLQDLLNKNPHKEIKNLISHFIPKSLAEFVLGSEGNKKCHEIDGKTRDKIISKLENFEITATGKVSEGEVVTCGGVDLKEINPKTLESKKYKGLYFCGEILDIDGFCGGFNLQNCWSTGFVVANAINSVI
ncbi:aminoacetone oxidase family FAD-binding enzyme [bacterium]|nr:aminoacetone oxidase family FAD-binding enzyme [bacterium]